MIVLRTEIFIVKMRHHTINLGLKFIWNRSNRLDTWSDSITLQLPIIILLCNIMVTETSHRFINIFLTVTEFQKNWQILYEPGSFKPYVLALRRKDDVDGGWPGDKCRNTEGTEQQVYMYLKSYLRRRKFSNSITDERSHLKIQRI